MNAEVGSRPEKNCLAMIAGERAVQVEVVPLEHRAERGREDDLPLLARHRPGGAPAAAVAVAMRLSPWCVRPDDGHLPGFLDALSDRVLARIQRRLTNSGETRSLGFTMRRNHARRGRSPRAGSAASGPHRRCDGLDRASPLRVEPGVALERRTQHRQGIEAPEQTCRRPRTSARRTRPASIGFRGRVLQRGLHLVGRRVARRRERACKACRRAGIRRIGAAAPDVAEDRFAHVAVGRRRRAPGAAGRAG